MTKTFEQNVVQDKSDIKKQLGDSPAILPIPKFFDESITPIDYIIKQEIYSIEGSFIIGHATLAQRDVTPLATEYGDAELLYVIPRDNMFYEFFTNDTFIADTSTGTLDDTNETYTLDVGEVLESEIIYKTDKVATSVELLGDFTDGYSVTGDFFLDSSGLADSPDSEEHDGLFGGTGMFMVSGDGGETYRRFYTLSGVKNFDTATLDGVKYKMHSFEGVNITEPIKMRINN